jgi:hypothetical protein
LNEQYRNNNRLDEDGSPIAPASINSRAAHQRIRLHPVSDHRRDVRLVAGLDDALCALDGRGDRLLAQHRLAEVGRHLDVLGVQGVRRHDAGCVVGVGCRVVVELLVVSARSPPASARTSSAFSPKPLTSTVASQ